MVFVAQFNKKYIFSLNGIELLSWVEQMIILDYPIIFLKKENNKKLNKFTKKYISTNMCFLFGNIQTPS